jgi:hypothetical protein
VSCSNNNEYVRNYQDCLTLGQLVPQHDVYLWFELISFGMELEAEPKLTTKIGSKRYFVHHKKEKNVLLTYIDTIFIFIFRPFLVAQHTNILSNFRPLPTK